MSEIIIKYLDLLLSVKLSLKTLLLGIPGILLFLEIICRPLRFVRPPLRLTIRILFRVCQGLEWVARQLDKVLPDRKPKRK